MLNKATIDVLSALSPLNNTCIVRYPESVILSEAGDIMVHYDLRSTDGHNGDGYGIDENGIAEIPIYNMSEFLNIFKLFGPDRVVKKNGNLLTVSEGMSSVSYILSSVQICEKASGQVVSNNSYGAKAQIFKSTEEVPSICSFVLTKDNLKNLKNASGIFKDLNEYLFTQKDGNLSVKLTSTNSFNKNSNSYSINILAQSQKEFEIKLPVENLNILPVSNYVVDVKYNSAKNAYRILLKSPELENFKILLSVKA